MAKWEPEGTGRRRPASKVHLSACSPSTPEAGLPPLPGSEVWVQSLLPGLGQPGHCDPFCFLPKAQPAYLLILPLISCASISPPPVPLIQPQGCLLPRAPVGGEVGRAEPIPAHPLSPSGLAKTASVTPRAGGDGERGLVEVLAEPRLPPSKGWAGAPGAGHFLR